MTWGLEVLVQLVMAATATWPSSMAADDPSPSDAMLERRPLPSAVRKDVPASARATRSWGRDGPAMLGTTVERSSSTTSEKTGSTPSAE
jgi:hypothetical protein